MQTARLGATVPSPCPPPTKRMFAAFATSARRTRSGPVAVHFLPAAPGDEARHVAYAIPRRVGTAVERNTYRRRLRSITSEVAAAVPAGSYLIGVSPGIRDVPFQELKSRVCEAMQRAGAER